MRKWRRLIVMTLIMLMLFSFVVYAPEPDFIYEKPDLKMIQLNNNEIWILGVRHDLETFEKYQATFEKFIVDSDYVILEGGEGFFKELRKVCQRYEKPVYTADPSSVAGDIVFRMEIFLIGLFFGITLVIKYSAKIWKGIRVRDFNWRRILQNVFLLSTGIYLFLNFVLSFLTLPTTLQYNYTVDYRNTEIAKGIEELSNQVDGKILAIHGKGHSSGILYYLRHSDLRKIKDLLYKPYELISNEGLRLYDFQNDNWKIVVGK